MKTILVTGSAGMVGSAIKDVFQEGYDLVLTDKTILDVRFFYGEKLEKYQYIDYIIHLAAETDLERCEINPEEAYFVNHTGTHNMCKAAQEYGAKIIYISTAGIFNGQRLLYHEGDAADPLNHYGRSKLYGEDVVRIYPQHYILRASWMIGGGPKIDKKFVNKVYRQIKEGAKELVGLTDVYGSPTYTYDLANTIKAIIEHGKVPYGTYNCAGEGRASRYDVLCAMIKFLGLENEIKVHPGNGNYLQTHYFCIRAKSEVLSNDKLNFYGVCKMRYWAKTLKEYLEKDYR